MFSTLFLLLLAAFLLCYLTSSQLKTQLVGYQAYVAQRPRGFRAVGVGLLALTALVFGLQFGWMTGLSCWLVGLMSAGCLVVALVPFGYLTGLSLATLYILFLGLELLF